MNGILNVLKPPGMTSHDVVNWVRKTTGQKKAGHTGTLDPGAAGVLPVCLGKATRIIEYLPGDKRYRAEVTFGRSTTTQDAFGTTLGEWDTGSLDARAVEKQLAFFRGPVEQIPPMTSAVKHRGKKLYELARQGLEVERRPRRVHIFQLKLLTFDKTAQRTVAILDIHCSAGTYVRTLCHDLGQRLGCGAYMSFLLRTAAGSFTLAGAVTLQELQQQQKAGVLEDILIPMGQALQHLPQVSVTGTAVTAVGCGNPLVLPVAPGEKDAPGQLVRIEGPAGLLALAKSRPVEGKPGYRILQPVKVLV